MSSVFPKTVIDDVLLQRQSSVWLLPWSNASQQSEQFKSDVLQWSPSYSWSVSS